MLFSVNMIFLSIAEGKRISRLRKNISNSNLVFKKRKKKEKRNIVMSQ